MTPVFEDAIYEDGQQYKDDSKLIVAFYTKPVRNNFKSDQEGRPIFEDREFIKIIIPGNRDVTDAPVNDAYRQRFAAKYAAYKANKDQDVSGTPLSELSWMGASQVAEFNALNVRTVEQLVSLPDVTAQKFMGFSMLKERCERFLKAAAGEAPSLKLERENELLKSKVQEQAEAIKSLQDAVAKLQKTPAAKA